MDNPESALGYRWECRALLTQLDAMLRRPADELCIQWNKGHRAPSLAAGGEDPLRRGYDVVVTCPRSVLFLCVYAVYRTSMSQELYHHCLRYAADPKSIRWFGEAEATWLLSYVARTNALRSNHAVGRVAVEAVTRLVRSSTHAVNALLTLHSTRVSTTSALGEIANSLLRSLGSALIERNVKGGRRTVHIALQLIARLELTANKTLLAELRSVARSICMDPSTARRVACECLVAAVMARCFPLTWVPKMMQRYATEEPDGGHFTTRIVMLWLRLMKTGGWRAVVRNRGALDMALFAKTDDGFVIADSVFRAMNAYLHFTSRDRERWVRRIEQGFLGRLEDADTVDASVLCDKVMQITLWRKKFQVLEQTHQTASTYFSQRADRTWKTWSYHHACIRKNTATNRVRRFVVERVLSGNCSSKELNSFLSLTHSSTEMMLRCRSVAASIALGVEVVGVNKTFTYRRMCEAFLRGDGAIDIAVAAAKKRQRIDRKTFCLLCGPVLGYVMQTKGIAGARMYLAQHVAQGVRAAKGKITGEALAWWLLFVSQPSTTLAQCRVNVHSARIWRRATKLAHQLILQSLLRPVNGTLAMNHQHDLVDLVDSFSARATEHFGASHPIARRAAALIDELGGGSIILISADTKEDRDAKPPNEATHEPKYYSLEDAHIHLQSLRQNDLLDLMQRVHETDSWNKVEPPMTLAFLDAVVQLPHNWAERTSLLMCLAPHLPSHKATVDQCEATSLIDTFLLETTTVSEALLSAAAAGATDSARYFAPRMLAQAPVRQLDPLAPLCQALLSGRDVVGSVSVAIHGGETNICAYLAALAWTLLPERPERVARILSLWCCECAQPVPTRLLSSLLDGTLRSVNTTPERAWKAALNLYRKHNAKASETTLRALSGTSWVAATYILARTRQASSVSLASTRRLVRYHPEHIREAVSRELMVIALQQSSTTDMLKVSRAVPVASRWTEGRWMGALNLLQRERSADSRMGIFVVGEVASYLPSKLVPRLRDYLSQHERDIHRLRQIVSADEAHDDPNVVSDDDVMAPLFTLNPTLLPESVRHDPAASIGVVPPRLTRASSWSLSLETLAMLRATGVVNVNRQERVGGPLHADTAATATMHMTNANAATTRAGVAQRSVALGRITSRQNAGASVPPTTLSTPSSPSPSVRRGILAGLSSIAS
eukprot:PhM_4_TR13279/c0_g1_i1/m.105794